MKNSTPVLQPEYDLLQQNLGLMEEAKKEIEYLGKEANLQGSETFGHDNPILETKLEKQRLLSAQQGKFSERATQLASCLILTEEEIIKRKEHEMEKDGKISIDVGSIVKLEIQGVPKAIEFLITGVTQGNKLSFMGQKYSTICPGSPIRQGIGGKFVGDTGDFSIKPGEVKKVKILEVK